MTGATTGLGIIRLRSAPDVLTLTNQYVSDVKNGPSTASAHYTLNNTGTVTVLPGGFVENWITPQVNMALYEARITMVSGPNPIGLAPGTWGALSTSRTWRVDQTVVGPTISTFTVEIRLIGDPGTILASATITLVAEVTTL